MEVGRRRKRRKGPQWYDLTKIEDSIRYFEWMRLEHMHLAAERSELGWRTYVHPQLQWDGPRWHLRAAFDCNLDLNEYREQ